MHSAGSEGVFSVVLVSYNSAHVLGDAIRSVPAGNQVIVADNASKDDSAALARSLGAEVIESGQNLGFGTACNRGAAIARHERLLFLNPDAVLAPDALEHLARAFDAYPESVAFNPRVLDPDGSQFFRRRTILLPRPYWFRPKGLPTSDQRIIMASGAALLVRKSEFDKLGGFDENIFLYYEDDDLSARIVKSGRSMHYVHDAVVHHQQAKSSAPTPDLSAFRDYQAMKSRIYASRKHGVRVMRRWRITEERTRAFLASLKGDAAKSARARARLQALREG